MLDDTREETSSETREGGPDTKEAEALAAALNHSAERVQTLWFSFLTFMLYLAIATGTTTHRMLFREDPLNLPVLNISLPLVAFYILTPIIFVVFHFYMLLNLVLLARTAKSFEDSLARAFPEDDETRENFRMRIENTLFVQLLVGGRFEREGFNARLLSLMALITLALAPVALLLFLEIKFLPYHSEPITWLHRILLALDLALVWTLWPGYRSGWGVRLRPKRSPELVWPGILSAMALAYAVAVATFPDEHMYLATHGGLGNAPVNTLDLHGEDLIDDVKLKQIIEKNEGPTGEKRWVASLPLAERDLTGANLSGADIRHVDFSGAILNRANLGRCWAEKAHFDDAQLLGVSLDDARLQGASLRGAQLQGASLNGAQLQGASLDKAQLQGAWLGGLQLQGASLAGARLQGAVFDSAQLQGAVLDSAQLQGASLNLAQLQGASLHLANLQGASLILAQLQGALLSYAQLQGASLDQAQLQGAFLYAAQLQGASLAGVRLQGAVLDAAQLKGASLLNVCAWRADARKANWEEDTRVVAPKTGVKEESPDEDRHCNWSAASFEELKMLIAEQVPEADRRRDAMEGIEQRLDPDKALEGEEEEKMAKNWANLERFSPIPEVYEKRLAKQWRETGCGAEGAPFVLRALLARLDGHILSFSARALTAYQKSLPLKLEMSTISELTRQFLVSPFEKHSPEVPKLAAAFLDEDCAGARGLSEDEITELKAIAAIAPSPAPKQ